MMSQDPQAKAFLGLSVGAYVGDLNQDFIPDPWQIETDRKLAYERWDQAKDRWFPNEISNFRPYPKHSPLVYEGLEYKFPEAFYQAMKSKDPGYRKAISECEAANKTKFLAGKLAARGEVRADWDTIKLDLMVHAQKHRIEIDPAFRDWLRATRHHYLYEFNNWNDSFWGVSIYTGEGHNMLGRIIMILRDHTYFSRRG